MPDGLLPNEGIGALLQYQIQSTISGVLPLRFVFFVNDLVPTATTVLADLVLSSFGGFTPFDLSRAEWTDPIVSGNCAVSTWGTDVLEWTFTSGPLETIYGYAYIDYAGHLLRFVQRFDDADIQTVVVGEKIRLLPRFSLTSCACPP